MNLSAWAFNKIVEQQIAGDESRLNELRANGKILLIDVRAMSTEDILEKLNSMGLNISKELMGELCTKHISAESLAIRLEKDRRLKNFNADLSWMGLRVLWERWYPKIYNLEMLDDKMHEGYALLQMPDNRLLERINYDVLKVWGETWKIIKKMMDKHKITDIESFDDVFGGTQSISNWSMDYTMELQNAMIENNRFAQTRIDFCTEYIKRSYKKDGEPVKEMISSAADTYFQSRDPDSADELFSEYLKDCPELGWGWVEWADQYYLHEEYGLKDTDRAISILKQGLNVKGLKDRVVMLEKLHDIYIDTGMQEEADQVMKEIDQSKIEKQTIHSTENKVGRNSPCPCGSGSKYKKCCGNQ